MHGSTAQRIEQHAAQHIAQHAAAPATLDRHTQPPKQGSELNPAQAGALTSQGGSKVNQALHGCKVSLVGRQVQRGGAAAGPRINVPAHTSDSRV